MGVASATGDGRAPYSNVLLSTGSKPVPLPYWAAWLTELGSWAAQLTAGGLNATVALSLPAREFASALVGCGAVHAAFRPQLNSSPEGSQFARAALLVPGKHVVRLIPTQGTACFVGILNEAVHKHNREGYNVGGGWFPADRYRIDVLQWPDAPSEFIGRPRLCQEISFPDDAASLLPGSPSDFCGFSALHCVIVGSVSAIRQESETLIAAPGGAVPIPLNALLRSRTVYESARQFRTLLLPAHDDPEDYRRLVATRRPMVTVLDGAAAVCRWLGAEMSPVTVALVQRTAPSCEAAADVLDRYRARSLEDLPLPGSLARVPAGIEVLAWRTRVGSP